MTIQDIKSGLDIQDLAEHFGISIEKKTKKANCPFHNDKTPSLQFSSEKQICTCFSSACTAGSMDVINLTEKFLGLSTHEALEYLKKTFFVERLDTHSSSTNTSSNGKKKASSFQEKEPDYASDFKVLQGVIKNSKLARDYLNGRKIDRRKQRGSKTALVEVGFNSRNNPRFDYMKNCVIFPLKDQEGTVVSLYGRSINPNTKNKHYYSKGSKGFYPHYPKSDTKKLIITESVIDAATLLSLEKRLDYEILALYGSNVFRDEYKTALKALPGLTEIILFLDGDAAGRAAVEKYSKMLCQLLPQVTVSSVATPEWMDINELAQTHDGEIFHELLKQRHELKQVERLDTHSTNKNTTPKLKTENNQFLYFTETAIYKIKGGLKKDLDSLKITLETKNLDTGKTFCDRVELYEYKQLERYSRTAADKLNLRNDQIELELTELMHLLDEFRSKNQEQTMKQSSDKKHLSPEREKQLKAFGKQKNLFPEINTLIGKSGVVAEDNNRQFLFVTAVSHLMNKPLNTIVQGGSGSGKSYLIKKVSHLVPQKNVKRYTRLSEKSFYNFGEYDLCNCLIIIEDYDGMTEEVEYAFRELQSNQILRSAVSGKEFENSDIQTKDKIVRGPIASMCATTRGEIYHDNSTRVFFIGVDESKEQTTRIIDYKNRKANGEISDKEELNAQNFLQEFVSILKPLKVKNPYLKHIKLPVPSDQLRRLHELFEAFCEQVVLIHQHQRASEGNLLIAEKSDVELAVNLMFDSIVLKVDELNGRLRQFYERLKENVLKHGKDYEFTQREIRQALQISKTHAFRHFTELEEYEYLIKTGRGTHGATRYKIIFWDDNQALRNQIKHNLSKQLEGLD